MDLFRFRPVLDGLEDKLVPDAAASAQIFLDYHLAGFTTIALQDIAATAGQPRTSGEIRAIGTYLRQLGDASRAAVPQLATFYAELVAQVTANPSLATALAPYLAVTKLAETESIINGAYSDIYSTGFGAPPRLPPPPPPPPPPGASTSLPGNPVGSTLPFSLANPAWQTLSSGVRIWDVTQGTGATAQVGSQISVNYNGYLISGTIFDSSFSRGQPLSSTLNTSSLIPGFVDGVVGMKVGGERRVDIPANLGYGAAGNGTAVPPNSELVFDITLLSSS